MAHTVRITTTTTENSNVTVLNTGYMRTTGGLLKLAQLILGIVTVALVAWYHNTYVHAANTFFLLMAVAFLISTTCLLVAIVASWSTGALIAKTLFVSIVHCTELSWASSPRTDTVRKTNRNSSTMRWQRFCWAQPPLRC